MKLRVWRWMYLAAGLAVSAVCLRLAVQQVRLDSVTAVLRATHWAWLVVALGALGTGYFVRIYRWWWMLQLWNPAISLRSCVWPFIVGFAVNNVVPFRVGDALRVVGFQGQLGTAPGGLFGSLLIERILDLTALLGFFLLGILGLGSRGSPSMYLHTIQGVVALDLLGWALLLLRSDQVEALLCRLARVRIFAARNWSSRVEHQVHQFFVALKIVRAPRGALTLLSLSAVVWVCEGAIFAAVAHGLDYQGNPFGPWFAMATGSLSTLIPSSPGYVGTFDFFTISGFLASGASVSKASATTLVVHAVLWLPLTVTGVTYVLLVHPVWTRSPPTATDASARGA